MGFMPISFIIFTIVNNNTSKAIYVLQFLWLLLVSWRMSLLRHFLNPIVAPPRTLSLSLSI